MATQALADVLRYVRRLVAADDGGGQGDAQLLRRFVARRDEAAFAGLLQRHAPLVLGVCRQVLHNAQDAEDAFQATFLVLARKAGSVRRRESLPAWLYRVALNVARTARARAARRQAHEREAALMPGTTAADETARRDWLPVLHEEVDRLPEKYRVPVVLCYLQAKTHDETARQLGWPLGTVKGRLARARDLLRSRLARRGLTLSAGALAAAWPAGPAEAAVPPALLAATLRAAAAFAWRAAVPAGAASARAVTLAQGVLQTMNGTTLRLVLLLLLAAGVAGAVLAGGPGSGPGPDDLPAQAAKAGGAAPQRPRPAGDGPELTLRSERQQYRPGEAIDLRLGVTNHGKEDFACLRPPLDVLANLEVTGPDGRKMAPVPNPPAAVATLPQRSPFESGSFIVGPGQTAWVSDCLRWINQARAETGAYVRRGYYPMEAPGTYRLRIRLGKATSNELVLKVLGNEGLAESPAVRANEVDFQTVAEAKCPLPAPGGKQPLYLGLRITNRGAAPLWFNKYDTLRPALTTADGREVPFRGGQRLRSFVPAPVLVGPGKAETVLRCPYLEWLPDGKVPRLRGPDGAGGFWYFDGLRPGKYRVRFEYENTEARQALLRLAQGERPGPGQRFWLGKVTTAAAEFEIVADEKGARRAEGGLQLTLASDRQEYQPGQAVDLTLTLKNNGNEVFSYAKAKLQLLDGFEMTGPDGKKVRPVLNPVEIGFLNTSITLRPGEAVTVKDADGSSLKGINLPKAATGRYLRHVYYPMEVPGTYRLRFRLGGAASNELTVMVLGKGGAAGMAESQPVRVGGVDFQAVVEDTVPAPAPGEGRPVRLGLRLTNRGGQKIVLGLFDTVREELTSAGGKPFACGAGRRETLPAGPLSLEPGESRTVLRDARLEWGQDGKSLRLTGSDGSGGRWWFDGLEPRKYRLRFRYENAKAQDEGRACWVGKATTDAAAFEIVPPATPGEGVRDRPAGDRASEPAPAKGLEFQVLTDPVWPAPGPGGVSPLRLQLRVTNRGKEGVRFLPVLGTPILKTADGKPLKAQAHGSDHVRRLPNPVPLEPGKAVTVTEAAQLFRRGNGLALYWEDQGGTVWSYDGLQPGKYLLRLHYKSPGPGGTWAGEALTKDVEVVVRELRASAPVVANQLRVCALADGTWQAPAAGQQGQVALGFRVTKVQQPNWARIIPRIAAVRVQAPDGTELPVKKVATGLPGRVPQALHMNPDMSRTLAEPASLARAGGALVLTWADSAGDVWQVAGLRPGTYQIRYVIRADRGKAAGDWTTWTGEVQTAAVEVTIKE
jgi:RNA polymerase sigma factor (sigma-70 family)